MVLSVAVSFALISPALAVAAASPALAESKLPACCRRDGKHRCSMPARNMAATGRRSAQVSITGSFSRCPLFPGASALPVAAKAVLHAPPLAFAAPVSNSAAVAEQAEAQYRQSYNRISQKRGPPPSLLV